MAGSWALDGGQLVTVDTCSCDHHQQSPPGRVTLILDHARWGQGELCRDPVLCLCSQVSCTTSPETRRRPRLCGSCSSSRLSRCSTQTESLWATHAATSPGRTSTDRSATNKTATRCIIILGHLVSVQFCQFLLNICFENALGTKFPGTKCLSTNSVTVV